MADIETALAGAIPASALQPTSAQAKAATAPPKTPDTPPSGSEQNKEDQARVEQSVKDRDEFQVKGKPTLPELAPEPKPDHSDDPIKGYVSAIGIIGAMSSAFARSGATNAMNAAAGVLNSMRAGDAEAFKNSFDVWKTKNENAMKLFDYQNDTYKEILNAKNKSVDERLGELRANAAAFKDDNMMRLLEARNPAIIQDLMDKGDAARAKMQESFDKIQDWQDKKAHVDEGMDIYQKAHPNATQQELFAEKTRLQQEAASVGKGKPAETAKPTWSDKAIEAAAKAVANGLPLAKVAPGLSAKNPNRDAIMNRAAELNPDLDLSKAEIGFDAKVSEARKVGSSAGAVDISSHLLDETLPLARTAIAQVDLSKFTDYNALHNYALRHTSDPGITAADTALAAVASDYATLRVRNGTSTDAARATADALSNMKMDHDALEAFFGQVSKESEAARVGTEKALNEVTSGGRDTPKPAPSQEDLEHTAKLHNMTVDEVKQKLGVQ